MLKKNWYKPIKIILCCKKWDKKMLSKVKEERINDSFISWLLNLWVY